MCQMCQNPYPGGWGFVAMAQLAQEVTANVEFELGGRGADPGRHRPGHPVIDRAPSAIQLGRMNANDEGAPKPISRLENLRRAMQNPDPQTAALMKATAEALKEEEPPRPVSPVKPSR